MTVTAQPERRQPAWFTFVPVRLLRLVSLRPSAMVLILTLVEHYHPDKPFTHADLERLNTPAGELPSVELDLSDMDRLMDFGLVEGDHGTYRLTTLIPDADVKVLSQRLDPVDWGAVGELSWELYGVGVGQLRGSQTVDLLQEYSRRHAAQQRGHRRE